MRYFLFPLVVFLEGTAMAEPTADVHEIIATLRRKGAVVRQGIYTTTGYSIQFEGQQFGDSEAGLASMLRHLDRVSLTKTSITSAGLRYLARHQELMALTCEQMALDDDALRIICGFPKLSSLSLQECELSSSALQENIASLKSLHTLWLPGCPVTDNALITTAQLQSLKILFLKDTQVTDVGVGHLVAHSSLEGLHVSGCAITDTGVRSIGRIRTLRNLSLNSTEVTDAGLRELIHLKELTSLSICNTSITLKGLWQLKQLKKLINVWADGTRITERDIGAFLYEVHKNQ